MTLLDKCLKGGNTVLDGYIGADTYTLSQTDRLTAVKNTVDLLDGRANTGVAAVRGNLSSIVRPFNDENHTRGVLSVLGKVVLEGLERVGLGRAVKRALFGAVREINMCT